MMASNSSQEPEVETENTNEPNWLELPRDVTTNIFRRLNTFDVVTRVCQVCPLWWNICKDPFLWRSIRMTNTFSNCAYMEKICHNAVGRSCGQLENINIKYFATDDLLQYIADCARNLRRLRIVECEELSYKGFSEAVKKLPFLEELEIAFNQHLSKKDSLEVVGQYCPLLKSLKYEKFIDEDDDFDIEDEAFPFSIAETMSGLRRLKICSNVLTTDGILAILDGCPLLECLDIQECRSLHLGASLKKMCHERIKDFRLPDYSYAYCASDDDYYEDLLPENWKGSVYGDRNLSMMLKHD